jgi:hypothetical protein
MKKIAEASKPQNPQRTESHFNELIFGYPYIASNEKVEHARATLTQKYLTGPSLTTMIDLYVSILSRNLNDKMFQVGTWTQIEDFWSFFELVLTRCSLEALFGSAIFGRYPGLIKDFWKYEDAISGFIPGIPRILVSTVHQAPCNRLFQGIGKWLEANHSGSEFAKLSNDDPDWDEYRGSKFIQERDSVLTNLSLNVEGRAADMLSVMHWYAKIFRAMCGDRKTNTLTRRYSASVNVVPSAIWTIVEILRKPQLVQNVTTEVSQHISTGSATRNVGTVSSMPILDSIHQEIGRLRMAQCKTYILEKDVALEERWTLPKGCTAISFSRDIAMNTDAWASARPRTVGRPLQEFWAERFLIPDSQASKARSRQQSRESIEIGKFNMDGLELLVPTIDEQQLALGGHHARAMQAATLSVLLSEFEMQLCDPQAIDAAINPIRKEAFGAVRPLDRIAVRIRKR